MSLLMIMLTRWELESTNQPQSTKVALQSFNYAFDCNIEGLCIKRGCRGKETYLVISFK